jgi:hypothetical protein
VTRLCVSLFCEFCWCISRDVVASVAARIVARELRSFLCNSTRPHGAALSSLLFAAHAPLSSVALCQVTEAARLGRA